MTTTSDPKHPVYFDEADVRDELTRVFDVCHGCRRCVELCTSFPTLFQMIARHVDQDAGSLTPAEQDQVVDECFQCKLCYLNCPYTPELHEWNIDVPRLMLRADAMQHVNGIKSARAEATTRLLGRTDLIGTLATSTGPIANRIANKIVTAEPGSRIRKVVAKATGVSSVRLLSPYAKQRFSSWFAKRQKIDIVEGQGHVTVFPTCLVEYQATSIGKDLVRVYERNGIECNNTTAGCCGAPWLHSGHVEEFIKVAQKNIKTLAAEVRSGTDIVVPQPTCGYIIKTDYPDYVGGPEAQLVAEHTYDAAEYLMLIHNGNDTSLDTDFPGDTVASITYHVPCHLRAQDIGFTSRDLMELTGAEVALVQQCSGIDGMWGLRAGNEDISVPIAEKLGDQITEAGGDVVAGDCHLANTAIIEQTGLTPQHPVQVLARAYGIASEP